MSSSQVETPSGTGKEREEGQGTPSTEKVVIVGDDEVTPIKQVQGHSLSGPSPPGSVTTREEPRRRLSPEYGPSTLSSRISGESSTANNEPEGDGSLASSAEAQEVQAQPRSHSASSQNQGLPNTREGENRRMQPNNVEAEAERRRQIALGRSPIGRMFLFFGYGRGNEERRALVRLISNVVLDIAQVAAILALTIYSGIRHSPEDPSRTEWVACNKPLGVWACLWQPIIILDLLMEVWVFRTRTKTRSVRVNNPESAAEQGVQGPNVQSSSPSRNPSATSEQTTPYQIGEVDYRETRERMSAITNNRLYGRITLLHGLLVAAWFLSANILVFSSVDSCRHKGPHLWWLVFSIVCLNYITILEILALGFVFFIIWPLFFIAWNLYLLAVGRHPLINPHYFNPEIGKIPKKVVDKIPLVLYVPTPPWEEAPSPSKGGDDSATNSYMPKLYKPRDQPLKHTYPPKILQSSIKRRFVFLKRKQSKGDLKAGTARPEKREVAAGHEKEPEEWEDLWDSEGYPFVRLDENRATCAICLLDFAEPRARVAREVIESWKQKNKDTVQPSDLESRPNKDNAGEGEAPSTSAVAQDGDVISQRIMLNDNRSGVSLKAKAKENHTQESEVKEEAIIVADASNANGQPAHDVADEPEPLRLLSCGHVFHRTCIDPWLTDVSGRCPTCQKPVLKQKKKRTPPTPTPEPETEP